MPSTLPSLVRFANFEVDLRAGELRREGSRVRLQEQPFLLLAVLLEYAGEVVTREEVRKFGRPIPSSILTTVSRWLIYEIGDRF
jgi:DNA-binding response OmpR family regulator